MFLIVEGQVKMILPSESGDEILLGVLDVFGELSVIDGRPRSATIVATEATETAVIERNAQGTTRFGMSTTQPRG